MGPKSPPGTIQPRATQLAAELHGAPNTGCGGLDCDPDWLPRLAAPTAAVIALPVKRGLSI